MQWAHVWGGMALVGCGNFGPCSCPKWHLFGGGSNTKPSVSPEMTWDFQSQSGRGIIVKTMELKKFRFVTVCVWLLGQGYTTKLLFCSRWKPGSTSKINLPTNEKTNTSAEGKYSHVVWGSTRALVCDPSPLSTPTKEGPKNWPASHCHAYPPPKWFTLGMACHTPFSRGKSEYLGQTPMFHSFSCNSVRISTKLLQIVWHFSAAFLELTICFRWPPCLKWPLSTLNLISWIIQPPPTNQTSCCRLTQKICIPRVREHGRWKYRESLSPADTGHHNGVRISWIQSRDFWERYPGCLGFAQEDRSCGKFLKNFAHVHFSCSMNETDKTWVKLLFLQKRWDPSVFDKLFL